MRTYYQGRTKQGARGQLPPQKSQSKVFLTVDYLSHTTFEVIWIFNLPTTHNVPDNHHQLQMGLVRSAVAPLTNFLHFSLFLAISTAAHTAPDHII